MKLSRVGFLFAVTVFTIMPAYAQFMPLVAKMRQTMDRFDAATGAKAHFTSEGEFYRSSDGSILMRWTSRNGDEAAGRAMRGTLWDNRTGIGYSLDFVNKRAVFRAKENPTTPETGSSGTEGLPEETIGGVTCKVEPVELIDPSKGQTENGTPVGKACFSADYDLTVKKDITTHSTDGKTVVHSVFELYDIHVGQEPDPSLFDLNKNFLVLKPQNQN